MDMADSGLPKQVKGISLEDVSALAERATSAVRKVRSRMLSPTSRKTAPVLTSTQVCVLCGIDKNHMNYRLTKKDLPAGTMKGQRSSRMFTLAETRVWIKDYLGVRRPAGAKGIVITVGNFKGGSGKTTTTMTLGQGLSLKGMSVLLVDLDPQGSLTTLTGLLPDAEIDDEATVAPLCFGDQEDIRYAIRKTYWDGIDLVPASPSLYSAEFALPARQSNERGFRFWDVLNQGLQSVRDEYDVILIDTPPSMSYLTMNALMAANGLIVPMPPNALDYASSAQFWSLFSDIASGLQKNKQFEKSFDFVHVLLSRVDMTDAASAVVREWITATYAERVLPVEIPKTAVTSASSAEFGTVYDIGRYEGSQKTYHRAREAYDRFAELIEQSILQTWSNQGASSPDLLLAAQ
ncbi:MAG: AAA family ATPase [Betaproteobacteria bacterium]|nr:AAA family ATPase [Betaproteobacteria bacterium]